MPLLDHLVELRKRLIYALVCFFLVFFVTFYFAKPIFEFLIEPAKSQGYRLIVLDIFEFFFVTVKLSAFVALIVGFPLIAVQIWLFVAPGLYKDERGAFLPYLFATPILFIMGSALVLYVIMPLALNFLLSFQAPAGPGQLPIQLEAKVSEYFSLTMSLMFAFGLCFQLPVALTLLGRVGIVTSAGLAKARRFAIFGVFVVAGLLTPPDALSQFALAVPVLALYEISIWLVRASEKKRAQPDQGTTSKG